MDVAASTYLDAFLPELKLARRILILVVWMYILPNDFKLRAYLQKCKYASAFTF